MCRPVLLGDHVDIADDRGLRGPGPDVDHQVVVVVVAVAVAVVVVGLPRLAPQPLVHLVHELHDVDPAARAPEDEVQPAGLVPDLGVLVPERELAS